MDAVLNAIAYVEVISSFEIKDEIGQQKRFAISLKTSELKVPPDKKTSWGKRETV